MTKRSIAYTKPVFDQSEIDAVMEVLEKGWLGIKDKANELQGKIAERVGTDYCRLCNSGSSANLLAVTALELPEGSEVITPACTFPTTLNPIIQNNLVPVFVEVNSGFVLDATKVEAAITPQTKAIMLPHLLGNMADMSLLLELAEAHDLKIIEDCCDAFDSRWEGKNAGSMGHAGTYSFYASHHFTAAGEGGGVVTNDLDYDHTLQMYRDWGRAGDWNWDPSKRFEEKLVDGTPFDERYLFRKIGYNLKPTEMQAAFALKQMERLDDFRKKRVAHFAALHSAFQEKFSDTFELVTWDERCSPAWFVFPMMIKEGASITRNQALDFYQDAGIEGRTLFVGNILLHPAYQNITHQVGSDLSYSNEIAKRGLFIGIGPQMTEEDLDYIVEKTAELCGKTVSV